MIIKICVNGQSMEWHGRPPHIADNSIEFVKFEFDLSPDWEGCEVVAQFTQTRTYNQLLVDDCCNMPAELAAGSCQLSLFGQKAGYTIRATSVPLCFNIRRSGFVSSAETPIPPTPDLYSQLLEKLAQGTIPDSSQNANFETDETLTLKNGVLSVNTTDRVEQDNTLPITSAGVYTTVGNIEALLKTI